MNIILLCGGKGLRLRPLTENIPKPLAKLNGKTILYYILNHLKLFKIDKITVSVGYKAQKLVKYLSLFSFTWELETSDAGDVDIIKRIIKAIKNTNEDFIVLYGDTISDVNLDQLKEFHSKHRKQLTMSIWPLKLQYGVVKFDKDSIVTEFNEKPNDNIWINIGYFYFSKEIIKYLEDFETFEDFLINMSQNKQIAAFQHNGEHVTVNSIKELEEAEIYLALRDNNDKNK